MINISNCPDTGLKRKVTSRDFLLFENARQIILDCHISHYKVVNGVDVLVNNARTKNYSRKLVASNSWVDANTGRVWTDLEVSTYKQTLKDIEEYPAKVIKFNADLAIWIAGGEVGPAPISPILPATPVAPKEEYDFFTLVIGSQPVMFFQLLDSIIVSRDLQGKFDI
jgi:hypothetical protein